MAGNRDDFLGDYVGAATNPAAPLGLTDAATQAGNVQTGKGPSADSFLGDYVVDNGLTDAARSWYTGANMEGVTNGWDTGFMQQMFKQYDEQQKLAQEQQDPTQLYSWFDRTDATGVSLWDDKSRDIQRGDVFQNGKKVANVFKDFDEKTANVMMGEFVLDAKTKQKIFADNNRDAWLKDEVTAVLDENSTNMAGAADSMEFAKDVDANQASILEGKSGAALVLGGAAGGAAVGAGGGALLGGVGAIPGAIGGAIVGAASAFANRDQLSEQTARALEISSLANKQYGDFERFSVQAKEFGGLGLRFISPVSNAVQGGYDSVAGKGGDGESEFYAFDADGKRQAPLWVRGADIAASVADGAFQFSGKAGITAYLASTSSTVVGGAGLMASTGAGWNDRTASFDKYDGAKEWAAGIGALGIDAVQVGFGAAIARAGVGARAAFSGAETAPGRVQQAIAGAREKLTPWRNPAVVESRTLNGMRFGLDEAGAAITARPTWTLLAPSEVVQWVPTAWRARNRVATSAGAAGPDDYYRAALEMSSGNRVGLALVNGWAESTEEAVQAVLEPTSFGADVRAQDVIEQALYGFAGGMGMSMGRISAQPTNDTMARYRADLIHSMRNQGASLTDEMWAAMSPDQKKRAVLGDDQENESIAEAMRTMSAAQRIELGRTSTIGTMAARDMASAAFTRDAASANQSVDGVLVMGGMNTDHVYAKGADGQMYVDSDLMMADSAVGSLWQTLNQITNQHAGLATQLQNTQARLEQIQAELATADPERAAELTTMQADFTEQLRIGMVTAQAASGIRTELKRLYQVFSDASRNQDVAGAEDAIDEFNAYIRDAVAGALVDEAGLAIDADASRRAVEVLYTRHPVIDPGSFTVLIPQASKALTRANAHGQVLTHQSVLKAMGADRDGDTMVTQNFVFPSAETLRTLRAGGQYLSPDSTTEVVGLDAAGNEITETKQSLSVVVDPPDGEAFFVSWLAEGLNAPVGSVLHNAATSSVASLSNDIFSAYYQSLDNVALDRILNDFEAELLDGNKDARLNLATALFNLDAAAMLAVGTANNRSELPWLMQRISLEWNRFQQVYASEDPVNDFTPSMVDAPLPQEQAFNRALASEEASNDGQTMSVITSGVTPVREGQKFHYSVYRALIAAERNDGFLPSGFNDLIATYAQVGSDMGQSDRAKMVGRNAIQRRVWSWLQEIADAEKESLRATTPSEAMLLLANTMVRDINIVATGEYEMSDGKVSLLQLLLKRSIEIEKVQQRTTLDADEDLQRKIRRLERLTRIQADDEGRSTTAQLALLEVVGHVQITELLGDSARYLGAQLTPNQLLAQLTNRTSESREDQIYRWRRKAPYVMHWSTGNPPYTVAEVASGNLSSYRVLVDALAAATRTAPRERKSRDASVQKQLKDGLDQLRTMLQAYRRQNGLTETDPAEVLEQMLQQNPAFANTLAALLPEASRRGAIQVVNGQAYVSQWVRDFLVQDPDKALLTYRVQSWLAEWNGMVADSTAGVVYSKVKSRMLQTFAQLAAQPDGIELNRLLLAMDNAPSLDALMDQINNEPAWRGDRAELLPFYDDVADFEADPADVWSAAMPGAVLREAIATFAMRTKMLSSAMVETEQELQTERNVLSAVRSYLRDGVDSDGGRKYHELLKLALQNRFNFPDHIGPAARDRLTQAIQQGVIRMHDKGKADRNVAPFGEQLVTVDEFGVKQSTFQGIDALTLHDVNDILTNPTKLVEGPVRVGQEDGSVVLVDLTTVEGALAALENPGTNAFAKMVLFPTARDVVGMSENLQSWSDSSGAGLKTMLDEANFKDVFADYGSRLTPAQAHKYISLLESGVRKKALGKSEAERAKAFFPIQNIINEFIVAYSHHAFAVGADRESIRTGLYVDVATALQELSVLHAQGGDLLDTVRETISLSMRTRFTRQADRLQEILAGNVSSAIEDVTVLDAATSMFLRRSAEITQLMVDAASDPVRLAELQNEQDFLNESLQARADKLTELADTSKVEAAVNMFTITGDPAGDITRKGAILRLLGTGNRKDRFQGPYALMDRLDTVLANDGYALSNPDAFSDDDWAELGSWASTIYLAELSGRAGSSVDLTPIILGEEGEQQRRFFDASFSYLVDGLLDENLLEVASQLAKQAKWDPSPTVASVAGKLDSGLLSMKKLGQWSELIVSKSMQARQVLASASVGLAIPVGGELPKEAAAYVGAGRPTFQLPDASMLTQRNKPIDVTSGELTWDADESLRLNNHFASSVALVGTLADGTPFTTELIDVVGQGWAGNDDVLNSPYKVIGLDRINKAVADALMSSSYASVELQVSYFDVASKPYDRTWANNIYFEGVGREGNTPIAQGLVGSQIFGVNAVSKQAQQEPLNQATKGGAGYKPTPITPLATTTALETGATVFDILKAKATHLQAKEYDTGFPHPGDLNSFYKLMTMRHVVVGTNASGEKEVWWAERAVQFQTANPSATLGSPDFPLSDAKLVPLSESQSQTLLGEPGTKGLPGVVAEPILNIGDMDVFPELTPEKLALLPRLGETSLLAESGFAGLQPHGNLSWSSDFGRENVSRYEAAITKFKGRQAEVRWARQSMSDRFDTRAISTENTRALQKLLDQESLAPMFARLGIAFSDARDMQEVMLTKQLTQKMLQLTEVDPSNVVWQHVQGGDPNPNRGVLTEISTGNGFEDVPKHAWPTMGDVVVMDLQSFLVKAGGNEVLAYDTAREVLRQYTRTGATVVLAGAANNSLRSDLAAHLATGADGYERMAESAHFFAPIKVERMQSQTRRALESTLTSTRVFNGRSLILTHVSDYYGDGSTENSSYWDLRPEQPVWRGEAITLLPTQVGDRYGVPVKDIGAADQFGTVRDATLNLLRSPEGIAHLKRFGGDPVNTPIYSNKDGVEEPGIRGLDDAITHLIAVLESGHYPIEVGQEIMLGDLLPLLGVDGSIYFGRVGFKQLSSAGISDQIKTPLDPKDPVKQKSNIAIAPAELQEAWTVRPPAIIEKLNPDPMAGASVQVKYDLSRLGKGIAEGDGWKTLYAPMPNDIAFPDQAVGRNGVRVNAATNRKARESKQATEGQVKNWGWAFALSGIDFRSDMVEFMLGKAPRTPEQEANDWNTVNTFLQTLSKTDHGFTASELVDYFNTGTMMSNLAGQMNEVARSVMGAGFSVPTTNMAPGSKLTANERLGQVILMSILAPRVTVEHVISTSGLLTMEDPAAGSQVTLMPAIFTDALEDFDYPELRQYLFSKVNAQLPVVSGVRPYVLQDDWTFNIQMDNPKTGRVQNVPGVLQISLEFAADENPVNYVQSAVRSARQGVSQHVAFVTSEAIGARTATDRSFESVAKLFSDDGMERFADESDGGFWQLMRSVPANDKTRKPWNRSTPMQRAHMQEGHARVTSYLQPVDQSEWTKDEQTRVAGMQDKILRVLIGSKAEKYRTDIDYMVRQMFGMPARREGEPEGVGMVNPQVYMQAAQLILDNVTNGMMPTAGGVVGLWHEAFAVAVFEENINRGADAWAPRLGLGRQAATAKEWDQWVKASIGQLRESEAIFDSTFRVDLDGFWHTWHSALGETGAWPVSMDEVVNLKLMDAKTNEAVASLDRRQQGVLAEPAIFDSQKKTLDALVGYSPTYGADAARNTPRAELSKRIEKHVAWHNGKKLPKQEKASYRKYQDEGAWYIQSSRDSHSFFHNVINLSVGMRLLNPALWTSAVIEVGVRGALEYMTNLAMGESTTRVGRGLGKIGLSQLTPEQGAALNKLNEAMGSDNRFLKVVYDELTFKSLIEEGRGRIGKGLESFAQFSARATSDPKFGMLARSIAARYNEAAMAYLEQTDNAIPFDTYVTEMNRNPMWLRDSVQGSDPQYRGDVTFNPHIAGLNRIAQVRSMKQTVAGKTFMAPIDLMTAHHSWPINATGHLLKVPFLFTRFNLNALTSILGLGGLDQMAAMMLDQRESKFLGKTKAMLSGREYTENMDRLNMADVLEGVDLIRPFVRGAITHTGLMTMGFLSQGLGLSGDDDETKRRRRLSEWMNTPYIYDPRRVENQWLYADAGFLDWLPEWMPGSNLFGVSVDDKGEVRSAAQPHWIIRQFLSPVIGIERFFNTGDVNQIKYGFSDAFSALPNSVARIWNEAELTSDALLEEARNQDGLITPEANGNATQLLINTVGVYERALMENSFVNSVRSAMDDYNRNPWIMPDANRTGEILRDPNTGLPLPGNAQSTGVDPETGLIDVTYGSRTDMSARMHQYAENNLGAATILSLFTGQWGQDSTYFRKNMVPAQKTLYKNELDQSTSEAIIMSTLEGMARRGEGYDNVTPYEISLTLRAQAKATGEWVDYSDIDVQAQKIWDAKYKNPMTKTGGFGLIDDKSGALMQDGANAVMQSLRKGLVKPGDEVLQGLSISVPMRKKIQEDWTEELVQDGIDLGLSEDAAKSRARRIWYGNTFEDPNATGLKQLLWSEEIPWNTKVTYNQLNVTFMMGPDGKPWATPFTRSNLLQAVGIPIPARAWQSRAGLTKDMLGNTVDSAYNLNTGLKGLERVEDNGELPVPDDDPAAFSKAFAPTEAFSGKASGSGSGWRDFGSRGYTPYKRRSYGSSGGYSSSGYPNFSKMYALPNVNTPYGNNIPFINTSNPILRRADIRRERVWSERGRLNQWQ